MKNEKRQQTETLTVKELREFANALKIKGGINTLEDLRLSICKDFETGIETTTEKTETSKALLVALLVNEARDHAAKKGRRRLFNYWSGFQPFRSAYLLSKSEISELRKKKGIFKLWPEAREPIGILFARPTRLFTNWRTLWPDALVVLLPLMLVLLLMFRVSAINKHRFQFVNTTTSVPAFHKLSDQVEMKSTLSAINGFNSVADVAGRYTLADIPASAFLRSDQVLSKVLSDKMPGRRILSIPIKASNYSSTLTVPTEAHLVLSQPRRDSTTNYSATFDVIVLRIEGSGETLRAVVAVEDNRFDAAASLLGSSEAFLVETIK